MISCYSLFGDRWCSVRQPVFLCVVLLAPGLVSCSPTTLPATTLWAADVQPVTPGGVRGTLGGVVQGGVTQVSMTLSLGDPGATYGWRISSGDCASEGTLFGGRAVYQDMVAGDAGTAEADAAIAGELGSGSGYAARIVDSTGASEQVLACGELRQTK